MSDSKLGRSLPNWKVPPRPAPMTLTGAYVQLEPLSADTHAADLFRFGLSPLGQGAFLGPR